MTASAWRRLLEGISARQHANNGFWSPVSLRTRPDGSQAVFPHLVLDRGKPGLIAVNPDGVRFVNEATNYHLFVEAMFAELRERPAQPCFLICDNDFIGRYGLGIVRPRRLNLRRSIAEGYVVRADIAGRSRTPTGPAGPGAGSDRRAPQRVRRHAA